MANRRLVSLIQRRLICLLHRRLIVLACRSIVEKVVSLLVVMCRLCRGFLLRPLRTQV